jgi:hypothetical protein
VGATGPADAAGRALGLATAAIRTVRGPRPLHPTGLLLEGVLRWRPTGSVDSGIAWIDERGDSDAPVTARLSRAAGLPAALPDVLGLALRVGVDGGTADLLLSTTGIGFPGRFLLAPHRTPSGAVFCTLMPYRGQRGPVLVAARSRTPRRLPARTESIRQALLADPWVLDLMFAPPAGRWYRFAELELAPRRGAIDSPALRFDPVRAPPPGAGTYEWTRLLRAPAYSAARRDRRPQPPRSDRRQVPDVPE